jgi:xanthine dehydrogenase accessory factor
MWDWIGKLQDLRANSPSVPLALVTLTQCLGSTPRESGAKMIVRSEGESFGTVGGGGLEQILIEEARAALQERKNRYLKLPLNERSGQCCGGVVEAMVEVLLPPPLLYIFGAGHVGQAVSRVISGTPFLVTLVDARPEWIGSSQIPDGVKRFSGPWKKFVEQASWDPVSTYAVVMTHEHRMDFEILLELLPRSQRFLGLIGSRNKLGRFKSKFLELNQDPKKIVCPIGIPLGGKGRAKEPQTIAISLAAQLLQLHYQSGHSLYPRSH